MDVVEVLKIKLFRFVFEDKLIWFFTNDMRYIVKSGYWIVIYYYYEGEEIIRFEGFLVIKFNIWRFNILLKIK